MRNVKYRIEDFALFDYRGVEKHLERMAAKGWQLSKIVRGVWVYTKETPMNLKYSVTYLPNVSSYDPVKNEAASRMDEYCESVGWKKVTDWAQMQIYCSNDPSVRPLETDESVRLDVIRMAMKRTYLFSNLVYFVLFAALGYGMYKSYQYEPIAIVSQNTFFYTILVLIAGVFVSVYSVSYLAIWLHKSKKSVESGGQCLAVPHFRTVMRCLLILILILLTAILCSMNQGYSVMLLGRVLVFLIMVYVIGILHEYMRSKGVEKGVNIMVTIGIALVLSFIQTIGFYWITEQYKVNVDTPDDFYYDKDIRWDVYYDEIPVRIEQLLETKHKVYSTKLEGQESFFLSYRKCEQSPIPYGADAPYLWYEIVEVKYDTIYGWCLEQYLDKYRRNARWLDDNFPGINHEVTNRFRKWGKDDWEDEHAEELYVYIDKLYRSYNGEKPIGEWLICKENYIICLQTDLELTGLQMRDFVQGIVAYNEQNESKAKESLVNDSMAFDGIERAKREDDSSYNAQTTETEAQRIELHDGIRILCTGSENTYRLAYALENGTELLSIWDKAFLGLKNGMNEAQVSLEVRSVFWGLDEVENINETAKNSICTYLEHLEIPYKEMEVLENAYADYLQKEKNFLTEFETHIIKRYVDLMADTEKFIYYQHQLFYPNAVSDEESFISFQEPLYFDKETGKKMNTADFFAVSEEELSAFFMEKWLEYIEDPDERKKVEEEFSLDYLIPMDFGLESMGIELCFPAGTLSMNEQSQFYPYEALKDILQPWARPDM